MIDQDTIFLLSADEKLQEIPHRQYESEDLLQSLIDRHPGLLVGEQIDRDDPPRWLMVQRETGIPDSEGGYDRWSIDHVLLDQHGRPTLVEVKRSTDTRIRREVVGQMLDYAANALKYWPKERIRELAANQYGGLENLEIEIRRLLKDEEADAEEFWQAVDRNQREGELRLLFVADQIPTELRRIIEFLNENMPRVEVLGVEIRQYERAGTRVLVPRVVGQTESARQSKRSRSKKPSATREEFLAACGDQAEVFFESLLEESESRGFKVAWGTTGFSIRMPRSDGKLMTLGYGVTPEYYRGQTDAIFEVVLHQLDSEEEVEAFRSWLRDKAWLNEHAPKTFHLDPRQVSSENHSTIITELFGKGEDLVGK